MKLENTLAFAKRKKQDMLRNMIMSGNSLARETKAVVQNSKDKKDIFKTKGTTFKSQLKARIEVRRTSNLKKISNKVRIKKIKV